MRSPWVLVLVALAIGALGWWLLRQDAGRAPTVAEIRDEGLGYDAIRARLAQLAGVRDPDGYAAFLFRKAYGRNPEREAAPAEATAE